MTVASTASAPALDSLRASAKASGRASVVVDCGPDTSPQMLAQAHEAARRLRSVGFVPAQLIASCRWTTAAPLQRLAKAGFGAVQWAVPLLAPTDPRMAALERAVETARSCGLGVYLHSAVGPQHQPDGGESTALARHLPGVVQWQTAPHNQPARSALAFQANAAAGPRPPTSAVYQPQSVEVRGLRLGLRSAWRLRLEPAARAAFVEAARADGFGVAVSRQPLSMAVGGAVSAAAEHPGQLHLAVVAVEAATASACLQTELAMLEHAGVRDREAVAAMLAGHRQLGAAYGFPQCCVEAFCDAFVEVVHTQREGDNALVIARAALRSHTFEPLLATIAGTRGHDTGSPLRHLPCRFDCAASLRLAVALVQDQASLSGVPPATLLPPARPVLVGEDGCFAELSGHWDPACNAVAGTVDVDCHGFDPLSAAATPWQRACAGPRDWSALRCSGEAIEVAPSPAGPWRRVSARSGHGALRYPLLLPFASAGDGPA